MFIVETQPQWKRHSSWLQWNIVPIKKALQPPMEYTPMGYSPNKKKHGFVMVSWQKIKKCNIKDAMSIKITFMHYMKWVRAMLPLVILTSSFFVFLGFFGYFFFLLSLSIGKSSTLAKIFWGEGSSSPFPQLPPWFLRACDRSYSIAPIQDYIEYIIKK